MTKNRLKVFNIMLTWILTGFAINLIIKNRYVPSFQLYIFTFVALIYLVWALIYHKIDKSLTLSIILEYLLTAALALILLLGIFNI